MVLRSAEYPTGTSVSIELEGKYQRGRGSVDEFLELTAIANPHAKVTFVRPTRETAEEEDAPLPKRGKGEAVPAAGAEAAPVPAAPAVTQDLGGLVIFLLAHLFYIAAFVAVERRGRFSRLVPVALWAAVVLPLIVSRAGALGGPVLIYGLVIFAGLLSMWYKLIKGRIASFIIELVVFVIVFKLHGGTMAGGFAATIAALLAGITFPMFIGRQRT